MTDQEIIQALREKVPQWISCKDKLPQIEQMVLVRDKWGISTIGHSKRWLALYYSGRMG